MALADLTIWRTGVDTFEVMSGRREDVDDLTVCASARVETTNLGKARAVFAVQGPGALDALGKLGGDDTIGDLTYFRFAQAELGWLLSVPIDDWVIRVRLASKSFFRVVNRSAYGVNLLDTQCHPALSQWILCGLKPGLFCSPMNSG